MKGRINAKSIIIVAVLLTLSCGIFAANSSAANRETQSATTVVTILDKAPIIDVETEPTVKTLPVTEPTSDMIDTTTVITTVAPETTIPIITQPILTDSVIVPEIHAPEVDETITTTLPQISQRPAITEKVPVTTHPTVSTQPATTTTTVTVGKAPVTTKVPTTTKVTTTVKVPVTTKVPETTKAPETTAPAHKCEFKESSRLAATCAQQGKITYTCSCGKQKTEAIPTIAHQYELTSTKESTTSTNGYKIYTCSVCSASTKESLPLKPAAKDADMCGESLLGKVLPHSETKDMAELMMQLYALNTSQDESMQEGRRIDLPANSTYKALASALRHEYQYLTSALPFAVYSSITGEEYHYISVYTDEESKQQYDVIIAEADRILAKLGITSNTKQKDAIALINDYICENKVYEYDDSKRDTSTYHSMFGKSGVCHNYSVMFQILCLRAGIECHYYASNTMNHAWNKVYFSDGSSYWVDVCWNDAQYILNGKVVETSVANGVKPSKVAELRSEYLLITTAQLLKDHTL